MIMAIMRAGYIAFPISPRNSPSAVAHLIKSVGVQYILVGNDQSMSDLADESLQALKANYEGKTIEPQLIPIPHFGDLFVDTGDDFKTLPSIRKEPNDIIIYLHSSGTHNCRIPVKLVLTQFRFDGLPEANPLDELPFPPISAHTILRGARSNKPNILASYYADVSWYGGFAMLLDGMLLFDCIF
jgi:hypothetical protein